LKNSLSVLIVAGLWLGSPIAMAATQSDATEISSATDNEWISITGQVKSTTVTGFSMKYGDGRILVEMDGYDDFDNSLVKPGDRVTVSGQMDNDFHEAKTIEASSVYVEELDTYFYANPADEEGGYSSYTSEFYPEDEDWVSITGTVLTRTGTELTLDTGLKQMSVDMSDTGFNPDIDAEDRVSVTGTMDDTDLFDEREIEATSVILLSES
jgi:uncharacterized protein YdeI (BOF family)